MMHKAHQSLASAFLFDFCKLYSVPYTPLSTLYICFLFGQNQWNASIISLLLTP